MCRSIKTLRPPYTDHAGSSEYHAAALQYVRKVSGFRKPAVKNEEAFNEAVEAIANATAHLMDTLILPPVREPAADAGESPEPLIHEHTHADGTAHAHA